MRSWERWWETLCVSAAKRFSMSERHTSRLHGQTLYTASQTYNVQWLLIDTIVNTKHMLQTRRTVTLSLSQRTTTKNNKQVRQQACKMQIPPYSLTQRRRPQLNAHRPSQQAPADDMLNLPQVPVLSCAWAVCKPDGHIHSGSNAAPVTPREPKFTKRGEDLSG